MFPSDEFQNRIAHEIKAWLLRAPRTKQEIAAYMEGIESALTGVCRSEDDDFNYGAIAYCALQDITGWTPK